MRNFLVLLSVILIASLPLYSSEPMLTPSDFGLQLNQHRQIDLNKLPPNIVIGNFNGDRFPDIARFTCNYVEVFICQEGFFPATPNMIQYFNYPITSIRTEGEILIDWWDIVVTLSDGSEERIPNSPCGLMIDEAKNPFEKFTPPPIVNSVDFELVWQSENMPWGMNHSAAGDIDNDSIIELVTYYQDSIGADTAHFLIYKNTGDDEYELYMEIKFDNNIGSTFITWIMITDMDQNGFKEILFTSDWVYLIEFTAPGEYTINSATFMLQNVVRDVVVCDIDQDSTLELLVLQGNPTTPPYGYYEIREYSERNTGLFIFDNFSVISQEWTDANVAVGDFDNDGVVDMVAGNTGINYTGPTDIYYYRYDTTEVQNFSEHSLYTGITASCVSPEIADLDNDNQSELFVGGYVLGGGSAYLYESTGFGTGYVTWWDTTTTDHALHGVIYAIHDSYPTIYAVNFYPYPLFSGIVYWKFFSNSEVFPWTSPLIEGMAYWEPNHIDCDQDGKENIIIGGTYINEIHVWEETASGIFTPVKDSEVDDFRLYRNYPNPFNSQTTIIYSLSKKSDVLLKIFDIDGREISKFEILNAELGDNIFTWDAEGLSSGIYFIQLENYNLKQAIKAVLVK